MVVRIRKRVPVPDGLKQRIATETHLIHGYVDTGERWEAHKEPRVSLEARLEAARHSELFYAGIRSALQISNPLLLAAQAEVARVHRLEYREDGRRSQWRKASDIGQDSAALRGRTDNYLQRIIHASEDKHIPKADFALLGHCFQMPLRCWEVSTYSAFEDYLALAAKTNLFAQGLEFLDLFQSPGDKIDVRTLPRSGQVASALAQPGLRVAQTRANPNRVQSDRDLVFSLPVPARLRSAPVFVILLEEDADKVVSLLSTETLLDHDPWFEDGVQIPRQSVVDRNEYAVALGSRGISRLYCVMSNADLSHVPLYRRSSGRGSMAASTLASESDLAFLRDALLRLPPSDWAVVRTVVTVE